MSQKTTHRPSTKPGTVFHLEGTSWHWAKYGGRYHIGTSRGDLAILPECGQIVKVIKASGVTSWEVVGPLLQRQSGRFIFEHVGPAFTPVSDDKDSKTKTSKYQREYADKAPDYTKLDAFYDQECS